MILPEDGFTTFAGLLNWYSGRHGASVSVSFGADATGPYLVATLMVPPAHPVPLDKHLRALRWMVAKTFHRRGRELLAELDEAGRLVQVGFGATALDLTLRPACPNPGTMN